MGILEEITFEIIPLDNWDKTILLKALELIFSDYWGEFDNRFYEFHTEIFKTVFRDLLEFIIPSIALQDYNIFQTFINAHALDCLENDDIERLFSALTPEFLRTFLRDYSSDNYGFICFVDVLYYGDVEVPKELNYILDEFKDKV